MPHAQAVSTGDIVGMGFFFVFKKKKKSFKINEIF